MNECNPPSPNSAPAPAFSIVQFFFLQLFLLHVFRNLLFPSHDNEPLLLLLGRVNFSLTTSNRFSLIHKLFSFFSLLSSFLFFFSVPGRGCVFLFFKPLPRKIHFQEKFPSSMSHIA